MGIKQSCELVDTAILGGVEDGIDRLTLLCRAGVELLELAREQLDCLVAAHLADLMNAAAVASLVEPASKSSTRVRGGRQYRHCRRGRR